ncbi:MAG: copper-binding protein [Burkholderiales bacterium]|nr:copper-binding protein [Opitutaceae bacterium]
MNLPTTALAVILAVVATPLSAIDVGGCYRPDLGEPLPAPTDPAEAPAPVGHPLRGVVVEILADQQALLVEHEEIPGVMKAMTMVLKVDAAVLATVKRDQPITATLLKKADGWWLLDVKPVPAPATAVPVAPAS